MQLVLIPVWLITPGFIAVPVWHCVQAMAAVGMCPVGNPLAPLNPPAEVDVAL